MSGWRGKIIWFAIFAYALASIVWLARDRRLARTIYNPNSIYNTAPDGLSLAYAYLASKTGRAKPLTLPFAQAALEADAVLFRVAPQIDPPKIPPAPIPAVKKSTPAVPPPKPPPALVSLLTEKEEHWVSNGGRLVFAAAPNDGPLRADAVVRSMPLKKVYPLWPGVREIHPPLLRKWDGWLLAQTHTVFESGESPIICRWPVGAGEVILVSCYEIFENKYLGSADHLKFLESLAGQKRAIYFDESVHGIQSNSGMLALLAKLGFGPLVVLLGLFGMMLFWRMRVPVGPPEDDYAETRSEAVDFVDSLAQIYDRALPRYQALALYHCSLVQAVSVQTGLRGEELKKRTVELTGGMDQPPKPEEKGGDIPYPVFERALMSINEAFRRLEHVKSK